jgi:hypothetical protein
MFQWDKSITTLDVPTGKVLQLYRSMRNVQLALPGLPAQEATAYLCQHQATQKIATTVVLHLLTSGQLACYVDSPHAVAADRAGRVLDQALMFIESMGFLMTDLDIPLLGEADREMLWSSLPLQKGVPATGEPAPPPAAVPAKPLPLKEKAPRSAAAAPAPQLKVSIIPAVEPLPADQSGVDDLLAAVEALRTRRPETRNCRQPPDREELQRRRRELTANLGRVMASL